MIPVGGSRIAGAAAGNRLERPMPMAAAVLEAHLREAFPGAEISINDLAGDGDHYRARIVSAAFAGLPRVRQHQLVYAALKGKMGGELHALALETVAPP
jgi:stress-induced morphogen